LKFGKREVGLGKFLSIQKNEIKIEERCEEVEILRK
jgi:hypothetical protein